jgi:hypothetical protein
MENFITSYLVKIGFSPDEPSYRKFSGALVQAEHDVATHTTGMARRVVEVQGAITGAFLGISASILGVVDKTAMADQGYRLMGLRMMMTGEQARKLSMITKTLGASLEEIIWDPELHARANAMGAHIDKLTGMMGPGFEKDMRSIRDVRAEFGNLALDVQFLGMKFTSDLWQRIAPGDPAKQLQEWLGDLELRIPGVSGELSRLAAGALTDTWHMLQETGGVAKEAGLAFTNVIGALSRDKSIEGTTFTFHNFARALEHVEHAAAGVAGAIAKSEQVIAESVSGAALALSGKHSEAEKEFSKARKNLTAGSGAVLGIVTGSTVGGIVGAALGVPLGPLGIAAGGFVGSGVGALVGGGTGALAGKVNQDYGEDATSLVRGVGIAEAIKIAAGEAAQEGYDWLYPKPTPNATRSPLPSGAMNQSTAQGSAPQTPQAGSLIQPALPPAGALNQSIAQPAPAGLIAQRPDLVDSLANAIAKFEAGTKENPISVRNNNPGNLRTWGDYPTEGGYAKFPDWDTGMDALRKQIVKNIGRGLTLEEFFAGKKDVYDGFANKKNYNDPEAYSAWVAKKLGGVDVNTPLNQIVLPAPTPPMPLAQPSGAQTTVPIAKPIAYTVQPSIDRGSLMRDLPSADDNQPRIRFAGLSLPPASPTIWPSVGPELAAALASMQRPILPQPISSNIQHTNSIGDINIYITEPGANVDDIHRVVSKAVEQKLAAQTQFDLPQLRAAY